MCCSEIHYNDTDGKNYTGVMSAGIMYVFARSGFFFT